MKFKNDKTGIEFEKNTSLTYGSLYCAEVCFEEYTLKFLENPTCSTSCNARSCISALKRAVVITVQLLAADTPERRFDA